MGEGGGACNEGLTGRGHGRRAGYVSGQTVAQRRTRAESCLASAFLQLRPLTLCELGCFLLLLALEPLDEGLSLCLLVARLGRPRLGG